MTRLRLAALMAIVLPMLSIGAEYPGAGFLMVFPDARTTALGGCGVALTDLDANAYYNPASLVTGPRAAATWTHVNNQIGYDPGMTYDNVGVAYRHRERLGLAVNVAYSQSGTDRIWNEHGDVVGSYRPFDVAPSFSAAYGILPCLSAGVTAKAIYSFLYPDLVRKYNPFPEPLPRGHALTVGFDGGVQYRVWSPLTLGASIENVGPRLRYDSTKSDRLPTLVRLGFALKPRIPGPVEVALVGDVWRDLVTPIDYWGGGDSALMFWENMRDGLGLELRVAKLASVRLGYFEDIQDQTGGILVGEGHGRRRISLLRYLVEHHTTPQDVGWCWGVGLEFHGVKLDVGVDENIFNYATHDVRFQLSARF